MISTLPDAVERGMSLETRAPPNATRLVIAARTNRTAPFETALVITP
jgi:hypothetical protein